MMNHKELLGQTVNTLRERAAQYGPEEPCFERIAAMSSIVLNKSVSPYDIAMIMVCVKLGRMQENRNNADNYIDSIAYMAFAGQFANLKRSIETAVEDDIVAMAAKLGPLKYSIPKTTQETEAAPEGTEGENAQP